MLVRSVVGRGEGKYVYCGVVHIVSTGPCAQHKKTSSGASAFREARGGCRMASGKLRQEGRIVPLLTATLAAASDDWGDSGGWGGTSQPPGSFRAAARRSLPIAVVHPGWCDDNWIL